MADVETIHSEMLEELDPSYQKSPGFPAYDLTRAFALAVASLAGDVEAAEARLDPENLTGAELDLYVWQHRAVDRKQAAAAEGTLRVTAGAGHISAGDLFATAAGVLFMATGSIDAVTGTLFPVAAVEPGSAGNAAAGTVTVMPVTIQGIGGIVNDEALSGGYDQESDEELRARYYEVLQKPANGGNVYQYEQWCKAVEGVGRAVVVPTPRGPNTVDVYLVDSNGDPADEDLVAEVQALLDPNGNGDGAGEAPIGAVCTVQAAEEKELTIEASLMAAEGSDIAALHDVVQDAIQAMVRKTALAGTSLRHSALVDATMVEGVLDYLTLTVNGSSGTTYFEASEVPVLGSLVISWDREEEDADAGS
jgi:uncharacterized phage protein gp47/JayE